jgi:Fe-S-cluster containining protein
MSVPQQPAPESVSGTLRLATDDWQLEAKVTVPTGPVRVREFLPLVQSLADRVVDAAVQSAEADGKRVSCKKGCGACCRQPVPIAETEAHHIREVLENLPEPRRSVVRGRFDEARRRLAEAGLLEKLLNPLQWGEGESRSIGLAYFQLGIPCPFLEEESCSIYTDRPIACREYLVTSPAENCTRPSAETVSCVRLPMKVWTAVARFDEVPAGSRSIRWVPLILAPTWAEAHPEEPAGRPGPDLLRQLVDHLTGKGPSAAAAEPAIMQATTEAPPH